MKSMSFAATIPQVQNRTKTVTRRMGWHNLKVGDRLKAVEKAMGLKKGQRQKVLAIIEITDIRTEKLWEIKASDVAAEGFPEWADGEYGTIEFCDFFCKAMKCEGNPTVRRIEFKYVEVQP